MLKQVRLEAFDGVIFDIDGVLVNTEKYQWLGWAEPLKKYKKTLTKQQYHKYAGKQGDVIESELIEDFNLPIEKNTLLTEKEAMLIEWFHTKRLTCMPFVKQTLQYFYKKNKKLAAASGSSKIEAELKLKRTGLLSFFQVVIGSSDVKRGKPFPDIYLYAAKMISLNPTKCLAFEDTQYGVESAKSAGLYCFAIPTEFSKKQEFSKADAVFKNFREATVFFDNQFHKKFPT
jgi:HAD superfamily hydrolase (TIGR01509 family)